MTLEEVIKKAISDNADCLGGECDCVALGVAKAVRGFLLSEDVMILVARNIAASKRGIEPSDGVIDLVFSSYIGQARAAISSITGNE